MLAAFEAGEALHAKYVVDLFTEYQKAASKLPSLVKFTIPEAAKLVIVGDLHGQLKDLVFILKENGFPGPKTIYLFNGDWVDRGAQGMEILCVVFALHLLAPDCVFLNRGNHEDRSQNEYYNRESSG
ncbi:pef-1 [Symbiodinium sp. KB8]|nr:pef-1 [Symbiodinium sp. KB8]